MQLAKHPNIMLVTPILAIAGTDCDVWSPTLVERRQQPNGNVLEIFEVVPGELIVVESGETFAPTLWDDDEPTNPDGRAY